MKTAILYICTGKYNQFFSGFYDSCEKFFLPEASKTYFVWTDDMTLSKAENVTFINRKCQGFPEDSLFRFEMFLEIEEELKSFEYIFFLNSNAEIKNTVGCEILPDDSGLVGAIWSGKRKPLNIPMFYPYERNKKSLAYIKPFKAPYHYYMGGINGGTAKAYLAMITTLASNIRKDYNNGIVALVHDESHINKYFRTHDCKVLSAEYCWPEEWSASFIPIIVFRDKVKLDPYFNKGRDHSLIGKINKSITTIWRAIRWYLYL